MLCGDYTDYVQHCTKLSPVPELGEGGGGGAVHVLCIILMTPQWMFTSRRCVPPPPPTGPPGCPRAINSCHLTVVHSGASHLARASSPSDGLHPTHQGLDHCTTITNSERDDHTHGCHRASCRGKGRERRGAVVRDSTIYHTLTASSHHHCCPPPPPPLPHHYLKQMEQEMIFLHTFPIGGGACERGLQIGAHSSLTWWLALFEQLWDLVHCYGLKLEHKHFHHLHEQVPCCWVLLRLHTDTLHQIQQELA